MRALTRAWRAERLATTRTRMASTAPSLDLGLAARSTTQGGPGGFDGVEGVGLAAAPALLAVGSVDLDDLDASPAQVAGQARAIGAGALNADLGDVAERLEPAQQRLVAGRIGGEALCAEQSTQRIERCGHMDVAMGIDTTGDPTRSFYDGHGHPFSQSVEGWHGRSGSEQRAVQVVRCNRTNHPTSETGRAVFQCAAGRSRSTTSCNVTGLQVRPDPPALPKLFRTSSEAVDP